MITIKNTAAKMVRSIKLGDIPEGTVFTADEMGGGGTLFIRGFKRVYSLSDPAYDWNSLQAEFENYQPVNITITVDGPADE